MPVTASAQLSGVATSTVASQRLAISRASSGELEPDHVRGPCLLIPADGQSA